MSDKDSNMIKMWEQMGSTTGSMIGKFIGLSSKMALETFNNLVVAPAKSFEQAQNQQGGESSQSNQQQNEGIRAQTWSDMGQQFGKSMGEFIGTGMDTFANTMENNVVQPMQQMEQHMEQNTEQNMDNNNQQNNG